MNRDQLREYLSFYRDLGLEEVYVGQAFSLPHDFSPAANEPAESQPYTQESLLPLAPPGDTLLQIQQDIGED